MTGARGVEPVLLDAPSLPDASLVFFRADLLVELKTDYLMPKLELLEEDGFKSWQIGPASGHHCHVDLARVDSVLFDAESVPCLGGRLNFTIWFLSGEDCGNPHRPNGLFSVVLNSPYDTLGEPLVGLIKSVYEVHDRHKDSALVRNSAGFMAARPLLA